MTAILTGRVILRRLAALRAALRRGQPPPVKLPPRGSYTPEQIAWLRREYPRQNGPEMTTAFNAHFGAARSAGAIRSVLRKHGIRSGRAGALPGTRLKLATPEQLAWLRREYPRQPQRALLAAFNARFGRQLSRDTLFKLLKRQRIRSGRSGCFSEGNVPANKGVQGWQAGGRSAATQFKPGNLSGRAAQLLAPIGTERKTADGYWRIKIAAAPYGTPGWWRNWKYKHILIWEQAHGPVPRGSVIAFRDGDTDNCTIGNLECVTRAEHAVRSKSGYYKLPLELRETGDLLVRLARARAAARRRAA